MTGESLEKERVIVNPSFILHIFTGSFPGRKEKIQKGIVIYVLTEREGFGLFINYPKFPLLVTLYTVFSA